MAKFIDQIKISVSAGKGGDGCMSFHRAKCLPKGGPNGGDGGRGGSVYLEASEHIHTLLDYQYQRHYRAKPGQPGMGSDCYGRGSDDIVLQVPIGTTVSSDDGEIKEDLVQHEQRVLVAKGGDGGLGNIHFKTSTNRAPREFTPGRPGDERELFLELKLVCDIGLVGVPNVGKSSLLRALTSSKTKVGDYPFTTVFPELGVMTGDPSLIIADIPGLLEGAHLGIGLGHEFLRHISRASHLLFVLAFNEEMSLSESYRQLQSELKNYDPQLLKREASLVVNKADLLSDTEHEVFHEQYKKEWSVFKKKHPETLLISAKHHEGLEVLRKRLSEDFLNRRLRMVS